MLRLVILVRDRDLTLNGDMRVAQLSPHDLRRQLGSGQRQVHPRRGHSDSRPRLPDIDHRQGHLYLS
jgi:hypothetical protein